MGSQALGTVDVGESRGLGGAGAKTSVVDGSLLEGVSEVAEKRVSSRHAKAFGESQEALGWQGVIGVGALKVVHEHSA